MGTKLPDYIDFTRKGMVLMYDYSIDLAAETIYHPKTKEYFKEVSSSYHNGNYRSAIVSLYTVVISDLIYKLKDAVERENDTRAQQILNDVEGERKRTFPSSNWENTLVDKVQIETKLLELHVLTNVKNLKDHRNLSAHPNVFDTDEELLYTPNKETVRAHIRNMLEGILTKPPMLSSQVVDRIITAVPDLFPRLEEEEFHGHIKRKYLDLLNEKGLLSLFRKLWKFVFRLSDEDCDANREVNYSVLCLVYNMIPLQVKQAFEQDRIYYSNISFGKEPIELMVNFFSSVGPPLFSLIENDQRTLIVQEIKSKLRLFIQAWYVSESKTAHLEEILASVKRTSSPYLGWNNLDIIKEYSEEVNRNDLLCLIVIENFAKVSSYAQVEPVFSRSVLRFLHLFSEEHFKMLLGIMNTNYQFYRSWGLEKVLEEIQTVVTKNSGAPLELTAYPNLV